MSHAVAISDAPRRFSNSAKLTWLRVYEASQRYLAIDGYEDADARLTADKVVDDLYPRGISMPRRLGFPIDIPDPGTNNIILGTMLEVHTWERGAIRVYRYLPGAAPPLLWSKKLKACYAYPGRHLPPPEYRPSVAPAAARLYRTWHSNKSPHGASRYNFYAFRTRPPESAIAITYRSDKFDEDGIMTDYIHHFERGVYAYMTPESRPRGFFIRGGRLVLTSAGLDH